MNELNFRTARKVLILVEILNIHLCRELMRYGEEVIVGGCSCDRDISNACGSSISTKNDYSHDR